MNNKTCKSAIMKATLLAHAMPDAKLAIHTDASDNAIGAVLQERHKGTWEPLAFFLRGLKPPQKKIVHTTLS